MASRPFPETYSRSRQPSGLTVRFEALLNRYPDLGEQELATMIESFPYLRVLDVGLMTADDRLAGKLEAFHRDHGRKIGAPLNSRLAFLVFPALVAGGVLWWALSALPAL